MTATMGIRYHLLSFLVLTQVVTSIAVVSKEDRDFRHEESKQQPSPRLRSNFRMDPTVATADKQLLDDATVRVARGVTFQRNITTFPDHAAFSMNMGGYHCKQRDDYGDNDCHFDWGDAVVGNLTVKFGDEIQEDDYISGNAMLDHVIPYQFQCPLCGQDCVLHIPVINFNYTIEMPAVCPVPIHSAVRHVQEKLWDSSPTKGFFATRVDGNVQLVQGRTGDTLVEFSVEAYVK